MITSQIALLINGNYEHLSPATHVNSLYIEKVMNVGDSSVLVKRYSVYKHFPIAVNKKSIVDTPELTFVAEVYTGVTSIHVPEYKRLQIGKFSNDTLDYSIDKDIKIARLACSTTTSSSQRLLLNLDLDRINLSYVLYQYIGKSHYTEKFNNLVNKIDTSINTCDASVRGIINTSLLKLNSSVRDLESSTNWAEGLNNALNTSVNDLMNEVKNLWKYILDTSLYSLKEENNKKVPWETSELQSKIGTLMPGCRYLMHYSPSGGYDFTMMLIAVSKNEFAKKVYGIPCSVTKDLFGSEYCNEHYENAKIEQWDLRYDIGNNLSNDKITFMRDEWGNEAPYDFKSEKTFRNNGSSTIDHSTNGNIKNNIIKSNNIIFYFASGTPIFQNNYIGYNNTFLSHGISKSVCNNYIGNNNSNINLQDSSNCYIGNNNASPSISSGNSCKIGDNTSSASIEGYSNSIVQSSQIDSNCSNVTVKGSNIHIYLNCHNVSLGTNTKNINIYPSNTSISHDSTKSLENVNIHYVKTENTLLYFNSNVTNYDAFCAETLGPTNLSNSFYFDGSIYAKELYEES